MESKKTDVARGGISITSDHWDVPLRVGLVPYVDFCRRIETQLLALVERWAHLAAPNASRLRRRGS